MFPFYVKSEVWKQDLISSDCLYCLLTLHADQQTWVFSPEGHTKEKRSDPYQQWSLGDPLTEISGLSDQLPPCDGRPYLLNSELHPPPHERNATDDSTSWAQNELGKVDDVMGGVSGPFSLLARHLNKLPLRCVRRHHLLNQPNQPRWSCQ